MKFVEYIFKNS